MKNMRAGIVGVVLAMLSSCAAETLMAANAPDAAGKLYGDRWYYCSRRFRTAEDLAFHRGLMEKAKAGGYNGVLLASGFDWCEGWNAQTRANFHQLRTWYREAGIEIIPLIWSTGYGAFSGANLEMAESEPVTGVPFQVKGERIVFAPTVPVPLQNGSFEQFNATTHRFSGWSADMPGCVSFVDPTGGVNGTAAVRLEPGPGKGKYNHARLMQGVPVSPGHRYRVTFKIRAEDLVPAGGGGALRLQIYGTSPASGRGGIVSKIIKDLYKAEGWRDVSLEFNVGEEKEVRIYLGTWDAQAGRFWVDDLTFEEAGLCEVNRREGTPFVVRNAASGKVYEAGRDYELPPPRMPKGAPITFKALPGGALRDGDRVLVDAYVPARHGPKNQISTCMSDPRLYEKLEQSAAYIMQELAPKKWFLSVDEVRSGNTCPLCTARHTDMAHILGEAVTRMYAIIKKAQPDATVYAWSDMFDPCHNAVDRYYGCKGTFKGVWNLIPKDIVMSCWARDRRESSVAFFTQQGFRIQAGAYYDSTDPHVDAGWMDTLNRTPGATGWMYTTWNANYDVMVPYGKFMNEQSRPCTSRRALQSNQYTLPPASPAVVVEAVAAKARLRGKVTKRHLVGHRGESVRAPENTVPAFKAALDGGFHLETDLYLTKDREVFCTHDQIINRKDCGLPRGTWATNTMWRGQLDRADAGAWKGPEWKGTPYPRLDDLLALLREGQFAILEIKDPRKTEILKEVKAAIERHPNATPETVIIQGGNAWSRAALPGFKHVACGLTRKGWWVDAPPHDLDQMLASFDTSLYDVWSLRWDEELLTAARIAAIHARGLKVCVWTVNDAASAWAALGRGIDWVCTDRPGDLWREMQAFEAAVK